MRRADRGRRPIAILLLMLGAACQPAQSSAERGGEFPHSSSAITHEEMSQAGLLGVTAFEAVRRLRPGFLIDRTAGRRTSSQPIQVSVNGGQVAGVSALTSIPVSTIAEIRYLTVGEAAQRFGSRAIGPVILVMLMTR